VSRCRVCDRDLELDSEGECVRWDDCRQHAIDWRARALAAESELSAERSMFMSDRVEAEVETRTIERVAAWLRSKTRHSDWDWEDDAQLNELVYWLADQLLSGAWRKT
jgi:hypothetical protein